MTNAHNIYIHVPFCKSKCRYCAFYSRACSSPDWDAYVNGIITELDYWAGRLGKIQIPTIFLGGGTPSLMPVECFDKIIRHINKKFSMCHNAEITLEANPGTVDVQKMHDFKEAGANRISIGVQSLDDKKLTYLGRTHSADDAIKALDNAHKIGIRVSADFIYGLPGENADDIVNMCNAINDLGLSHCSMYELTIEDGTPLAKSNPTMPDNNTMAQMYIAIQDTLNIPRYEVSNYATPGNECQHNMNIWDGNAYIGIGDGAAGRIFWNNQWYEQRGNNAMFTPISDTERAIEKIITGMRTARGVRLTDDVKNVINMDAIYSMPELLQTDGARLGATDAGMLVLDDIVVKIVR